MLVQDVNVPGEVLGQAEEAQRVPCASSPCTRCSAPGPGPPSSPCSSRRRSCPGRGGGRCQPCRAPLGHAPPRAAPCPPAVLPGVPHILQLVVPHVGHGEDEDVLVGVHTAPQLRGSRYRGGHGGNGQDGERGGGRGPGPHSPRRSAPAWLPAPCGASASGTLRGAERASGRGGDGAGNGGWERGSGW